MNLLIKLHASGNPFNGLSAAAALFAVGQEELRELEIMRITLGSNSWSEIRAPFYPARVLARDDGEQGADAKQLEVPEAAVDKSSLIVHAFCEDEPAETTPVRLEQLRQAMDGGCLTLVVGWSTAEEVVDALVAAGMRAEAAAPTAHRVLALDSSGMPVALDEGGEAAPEPGRSPGTAALDGQPARPRMAG